MNRSSTRDRTTTLQNAIFTLDQFVGKESVDSLTPSLHLSVKDGQLIQTNPSLVKKLYHLIAATFLPHARAYQMAKSKQIHHIVKNAIGVVKRNHLFLAKLQHGDPHDKQLAKTALATIKRYNAAVHEEKQKTLSFFSKIRGFFNKYLGLGIDAEYKIYQIDLPNQPLTSDLNLSLDFKGDHGDPLLTQEADVIRMKASTLLRQHGISFKSPSEALRFVKTSPIQAIVDKNSSTSTLFLTLNVLPGTTIKIKGSFKRERGCLPIADSFQLLFKSAHRGFPHVLQSMGWGLSDPLIPFYPHDIHQMPLLHPIYQHKKTIADALLPDGHLLDRAKLLLEIKQKVWKENPDVFLQKHQELLLAIDPSQENLIMHYFQLIQAEENPTHYISDLWEGINESFIEKPQRKLQDVWLAQESSIIGNGPEETLKVAQSLLENELFKSQQELLLQQENAPKNVSKVQSELTCAIGSKIGKALSHILLQYWSETLDTPPPMLDDFEQKLQLAALNLMQRFFNELEGDPTENNLNTFIQHMDADIALFKASSFEILTDPLCAVVEEIEGYYNTQHMLADL